MRFERPLIRSERPVIGSQRPLIGSKKPPMVSERPLIGYEAIGGSEGGMHVYMYVHTYIWMENLPHCVVQDCIPFGAAAQKEKNGMGPVTRVV